MRGISRITSSHIAFVCEGNVPLNVLSSWLPAPRPVPNSKRLLVTWSSMAARSAIRTGCSLVVGRLVIAEPIWILSVCAATHPMSGDGADMWLYSTRAWCSPYQIYFQLFLSAITAYSDSRMSSVCSASVSCAAGPGIYPLLKIPNSIFSPKLSAARLVINVGH